MLHNTIQIQIHVPNLRMFRLISFLSFIRILLELYPDLTVNGGWCYQRQGIWSQSVTDIVVYFPIQFIQCSLMLLNSDDEIPSLKRSDILIEFQTNIVSILPSSGTTPSLELSLFRNIVPRESLWCLEHHHHIPFVVIYLQKSVILDSPSPGIEWWECVFDGDERIDTLLCSIGTQISELPSHAKDRAEREHYRYQNLSSDQQLTEREYLAKMKQEFSTSLNRTTKESEAEEKTMQKIPERAEFLRKLRNEFPNISFVSK